MWLESRLQWWAIVFSLSFYSLQPTLAAASSQSSADEAALRTGAESFFKTWTAKDVDGFLRLWSAQAPELEARRKADAELFASGARLVLKSFAVGQIKVADAKASVRVMVELQVLEAQTGREKPGYDTRARTLEWVKEDGAWKVWRELSTYDEVAAALAALPSEPERMALLTKIQVEEKELATPALARALVEQGNRAFEQGNFQQALPLHQLARKLAEQLGDQPGIARALNSLGNVYWAQGDYEPAQLHFQQSLALSESLGDKLAVAGTLRNLGNLQYVQGNWEQAADLFRRGTQMSEELGDRLGVARGLGSLGVVTDAQGDYARALDYYQQGLKQFEALKDQAGQARTLGNLAIVYLEQDNFALALTYNQRSLTLFEALGNQAGSARTLHNLALVYNAQGDYAQALEYSHKSLAVRETLGDKPGIAYTLAGIGDIYYAQEDYPQALEYYQRSLALRETLGDKQGIADALHNLGGIHYHQGNFTQARDYLQRSLEKSEALDYKTGIITALGFLGSVYEKQGQYTRALENVERAETLARARGEADLLRQIRYTAGTIHRALNQPAQARQAFEEAIAIVETLRQQVAGNEVEQQRYFESKLAPYHALVSLLSTQDHPAEALAFAERAKSRALLDVLHGGRIGIQKAMTPAEREEERRLKAQLTQLNAQLAEATQADKPAPQLINELKQRQDRARLAYEAFQTSLYAAHPELKTQRGEAPVIQAAELAALLPATTSALLEFVVTKHATYLFTVTRNTAQQADVRVFTLPVPRAELARQVESFRQQLANRELGFRAAAAQLYTLLLKPAQAQLKGKTNLIIVPDDKLWDLPFQALLTGAQRFVLEDAAITYAPSLTVLREMSRGRAGQQAATAPPTLLAFGNPALGQETIARTALTRRAERLAPLPAAEREVKALGQLYGAAHSKIYVGAAAREDRAKAEAGNARVLHFATHGVLNNAAPLYSYLVLAQGEVHNGAQDDGLLEAWELLQLDLNADLAVLSACETARGRIGAGEGVIGLTWALFVAGVPATVVSQWKVESAGTRDLLLDFHRQLLAPGKTTKATALRQAALKLLKQPDTSHPFYWAGFVLVGNGR
ncbi:MAG: tetratricopeptide repeat protein [Acidobacteria bacterium]|nr:tetratricopeptide repeat protein [Acidobacteriota bacterium]MBI3428165.1 tetratricopeptide repeat protein [Acidobacteriota bacterium]